MGDTSSPIPAADCPREPWGSWSSLFQQSADPVFLLSRRRQIRFVNKSWEALTGKSFDSVRGLFCLQRKKKGTLPQRVLLQTLAPPTEVMEGRTMMVRRPVPPRKLGPPWWDFTFIPLRDASGLTGIFGFIHAVDGPAEPASGGGFSEAMIALRQKMAARFSYELLQSDCFAMRRIEAQARLAASTRTSVWIGGEAGTGKETLARIIHFNGLAREQPFLALDCRGLQPFLLRNMLFGVAGQVGACLGTVYLKNPESMPRDLQTEMLAWIEEQESPPRIIAGTRDLTGAAVRIGHIVEEFHIALNVLEIHVPPLRERIADLPRLANGFLRRDYPEGLSLPVLAPEVFGLLGRHTWPGNLRELAEVVREAALLAKDAKIEPGHLPLALRAGMAPPIVKPPKKLDEILEEVETRMIRLALKKSKGNKSEAADALGIPRARLLRRIEILNDGV